MNVADDYKMPVFREAAQEFSAFLESQWAFPDLLWVFREDVCQRGRRFFVRFPVPEENKGIAEKLYDQGVERGLGVRLEALCLLGSRTCCYVWLPSDEVDASYAMLSGLKFSVPTSPEVAQPVRSGLSWWVHRWLESRERFNAVVEQLPLRAG